MSDYCILSGTHKKRCELLPLLLSGGIKKSSTILIEEDSGHFLTLLKSMFGTLSSRESELYGSDEVVKFEFSGLTEYFTTKSGS